MSNLNAQRLVDTSIKAGDYVRSYDFPHIDSSYVEGTVECIHFWEGCNRYAIKVERVVFDGQIVPDDEMIGNTVNPPVNGVPTLAGTLTSYVHKTMRKV